MSTIVVELGSSVAGGASKDYQQRNIMSQEDSVTLVAEGRSFHCHKEKLINASDYFRAMFSNNFTERTKNTIELQDIDADCLQTLLQYVETGCYTIQPDNILNLLQTAAMLQFSQIQKECEQQVLSSLTIDGSLEVYLVTTTLGLQNVASAALTIALWNFSVISKKAQFLQLNLPELVEYVNHPALHPGPGGEWTVWEAIVAWIEEDEVERSEYLMQLLDCLDFQALTEQDISNILFYPIVSENDEAVRLLDGIKAFKKEQAMERNCHCSENDRTMKLSQEMSVVDAGKENEVNENQINSDITKATNSVMSKQRRKTPQVPCVVGFKRSSLSKKKKKAKDSDEEEEYELPSSRVRNSEMVPVVYSYNLKSNTITEEVELSKLCAGPVYCSGYQVCSLGPSIVIFGGEYLYGNGNWNKSVWRYSTASRKWIIEHALPQPRRHKMMCVIDTVIYLIGGDGKYRVVQSSVDAYDTATGEWLQCPDMPHSVGHGAVCNYKGRLMVFTQEMQLLSYYPKMRKWSAIPIPSPSKQGYRAALVWGSAVYLVDNCSSKVYEFLPEDGHTISYFGQFIAAPANVCVVDGKIFNFSHDDLDDSHVIEVLDINQIKYNQVDKETASKSEISKPMEGESEIAREDHQDTATKVIGAGVKTNGKRPVKGVLAKEVFREKDAGPHTFTTKCPADTTFSLGCFPLFKLGY